MSSGNLTQLLSEYNAGNRTALPMILPPIFRELKALSQRGQGVPHSPQPLQPAALLHEAFSKLVDGEVAEESSRILFFSLGAQLLRRIFTEQAKREQLSTPDAPQIGPDHVNEALRWSGEEGIADVLAVDNALEELAEFNPRQARIFELRYFGGMTLAEAASLLKTEEDATRTDWEEARHWVLKFIQGTP